MSIGIENLRKIGKEHGLWPQMDHGRVRIKFQPKEMRPALIQQYNASYLEMGTHQWNHVLNKVGQLPDGDIQIIDYGCGEGQATAHFCRMLETRNALNMLTNITYLEESEERLEKAINMPTRLTNAKINPVCKALNDVQANDILLEKDATKFHLFSNILDIETFCVTSLLREALTCSGRHIFVAVSHHRYHHGGTPRLQTAYKYLVDNGGKKESPGYNWTLPNNMNAVWFAVELDV